MGSTKALGSQAAPLDDPQMAMHRILVSAEVSTHPPPPPPPHTHTRGPDLSSLMISNLGCMKWLSISH